MDFEFREFKYARLINAYLRGELSEADSQELNRWLDESPENRLFFETELNRRTLSGDLKILAGKNNELIKEEIAAKIGEPFTWENTPPVILETKRKPLWRIRYVAAAAGLIGIIVTAGLLLNQQRHGKTEPVRSADLAKITDVAPGGNKAVLILSDGSRIVLDSVGNGKLATQNGSNVSKLDSGKLAYTIAGDLPVDPAVTFNTLATPRSGQFEVRLPDGTKVWLNNASRLHYPTVFKGDQRTVDLEGEAYFEVAKDAAHPFVVKTRGQKIEVLGTGFNIMSYADEALEKTTLIEGKISVSSASHNQVLEPGQQAASGEGGKWKVAKADTWSVTSWRKGIFNFDNSDLPGVMRQLARWYDVDITFEGDFPNARTFDGNIGRNLNLSQVIRILEANQIHTRLDGKKLIVTP